MNDDAASSGEADDGDDVVLALAEFLLVESVDSGS